MRKDNKVLQNNSNPKLNFIYNSAYQIFAIIVPLITTPYLTRTIGARGIGDYSFAYSVAYYFGIVIKLGLNNYGGRQIAYIRDDRNKLSVQFWEIHFFQLFVGLIVFFVYSFYCFLFSNSIISWLFVLYIISATVDVTWFYWGMEEFKLTVRRDFIIKIFTTVGIFIFVKSYSDTWLYTLLLCIGFLGSQLLLWPTLHRYVDYKMPSRKGVVRHIKPNVILFIPTIATSLYKIMDKIMLGIMTSNTAVGFYQSSENIIAVPMALINSLGIVMQPRMANMVSKKADSNVMESIFSKTIDLAMFLSTSIGFGIMTVSKEFVPIFFGEGFAKCIILLQILLPSCFFLAFANVIRTQYLIPRQKDREFLISLFTGAFVNLVLNSVFIPRIESIGAAVGTLCAEASVCIVQAFLMQKEINTLEYIIQSIPFLFSGLMMYVAWRNVTIINESLVGLFLKIILAGSSYLFILYITLLPWKRLGFSSFTFSDFIAIVKNKRKRVN